MRKTSAYVVLAIAFTVISIVAFAVPTAKTETFTVAYIFTVAAFLAQIPIRHIACKKNDGQKSRFFGIPLLIVGSCYLVIQLIVFALFVIFPTAPIWITVIVCVCVAGVSAICLIGTGIARGKMTRTEEKIDEKVSFTERLQSSVNVLAQTENDASVKKRCWILRKKSGTATR